MQNRGRWFFAPCGLDCATCTIHLRTTEELEYWRQQNVDPEKIRCDGCRSDRSGHHWSPDCEILQCCVYDRRLEFCSDCPDFTCSKLEQWAKDYEHHAQALEKLRTMRTVGTEEFLKSVQ
jgi:hypothetical protein